MNESSLWIAVTGCTAWARSIVVGLLVATLLGGAPRLNAMEQSPVTAIGILLEPDGTMLSHAQANNSWLLQIYPTGFALDEAHRPHITLVQRFVRTNYLDKVFVAAGLVFAGATAGSQFLRTSAGSERPELGGHGLTEVAGDRERSI